MTPRPSCAPALVLVGALSAACGPDTMTPAADHELADLPADQVCVGCRHRITQEGVSQGTLVSDTVLTFTGSSEWELRGLHLTFYDADGVESGRLIARGGTYDHVSGLLVARQDASLRIRAPAGADRVIEADEISFDRQGERLWTDGLTRLEQGDRCLEGHGFESDLAFENVRIHGGRSCGAGERPRAAEVDEGWEVAAPPERPR